MSLRDGGLCSEVVTLLLCCGANALDCTRAHLLSPGLSHGYALLHHLRQLENDLASDWAFVECNELFDFIGRKIIIVNRDNGLLKFRKRPFHFLRAYTGKLIPDGVRNFLIFLFEAAHYLRN